MKKFRKRPIEIEANQWFKIGDHEKVVRTEQDHLTPSRLFLTNTCKKCKDNYYNHGWVGTLEGGHIVCPGDWIIKGVRGEFYPCKPDVFEKSYEPVIQV